MSLVSGWPYWQRLALAAGLGVIAALGLAPNSIWVATIAALLLIPMLALSVTSRRRAAGIGWAFGVGYFAHGLSWIVEPFMVDPERHAWMAPFALIFMAGGLALFWAAAFFSAHVVRVRPARRIWLLALCLGLAEFARGHVLTGFPWAGFAQIWIETDAALLLAWIGPNGLACVTLIATFLPGHALTGGHGGVRLLKRSLPALLMGGAVLVSGRLAPDVTTSGHVVRLVQPNAPQHQKWDPAFSGRFLQRQLSYTTVAPRPDLVVWPETSVPYWLGRADGVIDLIAEAAQGAPVVFGINRAEDNRIYNSLVSLDASGNIAATYDKSHLVPFGEYIPLGDMMARFGLTGFAVNRGQGFSAGSGPAAIQLGEIGTAIPLICYEAVFPQDILAAPERADLLLQITNDAWFGTRSGPHQHLAQARMRAVEQGVPLIRAANTGISAIVDPLGDVTASLPLGQAGFVDGELPNPLAPTLYSKTGDMPLFILMLSLVLGALRIQVAPFRVERD